MFGLPRTQQAQSESMARPQCGTSYPRPTSSPNSSIEPRIFVAYGGKSFRRLTTLTIDWRVAAMHASVRPSGTRRHAITDHPSIAAAEKI